MAFILLQIFLTAFLVNLAWEFAHSRLYETCLRLPFKKTIPLLTRASLKDAFWIVLFFLASVIAFKNTNILTNYFQLLSFVFLSATFSFIDEKISLRFKRWEYSKVMPTVLGVGITPLIELAVTGIITFLVVFLA